MKTSIKIITVFLLISNFCSAQIQMGSISKETKEESVIPAPAYDSSESFIIYDDFKWNSTPPSPHCKESEFYKRYLNLVVYYPTYTNDYKQKKTLIFKEGIGETIEELNWSELAEKYFTIKNIEIPFEKADIFSKVSKVKPALGDAIKSGLLFTLEDRDTKNIVYVSEFYAPSFILTDYYTAIANYIPQQTFVAIKGFNGRTLPLSEKMLYVDKGSEWNAEFTLLRKSDMNLDPTYKSTSLQDVIFMVVLTRNSDKIITYYDSKDYYESLWNCFDTKEGVIATKLAIDNKAKQRLSELTKLYGEVYAKDIINHKLSIGMSKEMCQESVGITLNRWSYTDANGKIEVWKYVGALTLYFTDGKLSNIIKY